MNKRLDCSRVSLFFSGCVLNKFIQLTSKNILLPARPSAAPRKRCPKHLTKNHLQDISNRLLTPVRILSLVILLCKKQSGQFLANLTQPHNLFRIMAKNQPLNTGLSTDFVDKHNPEKQAGALNNVFPQSV
ncbi:MAG: hypothetical protein PHG00_04980 [Methylococcales bacterium]|nr:hypothetical protein [Methylococcales bacterium]